MNFNNRQNLDKFVHKGLSLAIYLKCVNFDLQESESRATSCDVEWAKKFSNCSLRGHPNFFCERSLNSGPPPESINNDWSLTACFVNKIYATCFNKKVYFVSSCIPD